MKKLLFLTLVLITTICCYADKYKIIELNPSPIQIGKKNLKVGDTFDETSVITWTSPKQYMRAENLTTHNLRKYSSSAMTAKGANSISSYRMKVKKLSGRNVESDEPFRLSGKNKSRFAEKRIALVMGNSEYDNISYLENAVYDATQIADNLQELGFDVIACYDAQIGEMKRALRIFGNEALSGKYDVAVFYYAGHGVQNRTDGLSYMLPVDIDMDNSYINARSCLAALDIRDEIQMAECKVNILIFDACRTNMYMRELSSAAFSMEPGKNTVVMFSTSNGEQAMDKYKGCVNGPFATALMNGINQPGHEVTIMLNNVSRHVYEITDHQQTPSISSNLVEQFYFTQSTPANYLDNNILTDNNLRFNRAITDLETGNYAEAFLVFRELANNGHAEAQYYLGYCYDHGYGHKPSYDEALIWYSKAAENGHAEAQYNLGRYYYCGYSVQRSEYEAVKWYRNAAEQGYAKAQCYLGKCYSAGEGVQQSFDEAIKWYSKAAEQGDAQAQFKLGKFYYNGFGVQQSCDTAVNWYRKAAEQGDAVAQLYLGRFYFDGNCVQQSYDEAVTWFRKAAQAETEEGKGACAWARFYLGVCYENGYSVQPSYSEAWEWYQMAAEKGLSRADAQNLLGHCYYYGAGVPQSYKEAVKWYQMAAENGHLEAQYNLGNCYEKGLGVPPSIDEAVKWYRKAAENDYFFAKERLKKLSK